MTYIVQPGDSLYSIAMRFNTTVEALMEVNDISDPSMIYPGQILIINDLQDPDQGFRYIVQPGESLYQIARRYNVSLRELIRINDIQPPYVIYPGQSIIIPGEAPEPPGGGRVYIVQEGDTLYSIAESFNVSLEELIRLNSIPRPDLIYPGQRLLIPPTL